LRPLLLVRKHPVVALSHINFAAASLPVPSEYQNANRRIFLGLTTTSSRKWRI